MSVSDLTGTTWQFNTIGLTWPEEITYYVDYTILCNNSAYNANDGTALIFDYHSAGKRCYNYLEINTSNDISFNGISGEGVIYEDDGSNTNTYLEDTRDSSLTYVTGITITGGTDATNAELIEWLEANATLIAPQPTGTNNVYIGTLSLSKAFLGTTELSAIWLGNVKIYEKGSPTPSGYSGNIAVYGTFGGVYIYTKIKFDTPPTDDNDYDSYVNMSGELTGLTSYQNKTKIYIWCDTDYDNSSSFVRINGITYNGSRNYSQATEVLLTGNYDIELGYSRTGGAGF